MKQVSDNRVNVAMQFLFPSLETYSEAYRDIRAFILEEFENLQTAVLYFRNKSFVDLITSYGLNIGTKEVIITPKSVLATPHYHAKPKEIYCQY